MTEQEQNALEPGSKEMEGLREHWADGRIVRRRTDIMGFVFWILLLVGYFKGQMPFVGAALGLALLAKIYSGVWAWKDYRLTRKFFDSITKGD